MECGPLVLHASKSWLPGYRAMSWEYDEMEDISHSSRSYSVPGIVSSAFPFITMNVLKSHAAYFTDVQMQAQR